MDRKYILSLILIAIMIILIIVFSLNLLISGYSIEFYKNYDEDNRTESNPTFENPIPYVFRNSSLTPVYIAVVVKKDFKPVVSKNVTLDIWNQESHQYFEKKTNIEGYAVFIIPVNAIRDSETVYSYSLYLSDDKKIATDLRKIVVPKDPVDLAIDYNLGGMTTHELQDSGIDPKTNKPSEIPEGDNFIIVGVLTMMLLLYVMTQKRAA